MSASKLDTSGAFSRSAQARFSLPANAVRIRRNGIEFLSSSPVTLWSEMTIEVQSEKESKKVRATGVVIECNGTRQTGYSVSIMFTNISRQAEESLRLMAYS